MVQELRKENPINVAQNKSVPYDIVVQFFGK